MKNEGRSLNVEGERESKDLRILKLKVLYIALSFLNYQYTAWSYDIELSAIDLNNQ